MLRIVLEYSLSQIEEDSIENLICQEFSMQEKKEIVMSLNDERVERILIKIGIKDEFLKTIKL